MELKTGIRGSACAVVTELNTARAMGSGALRVFATPAMTALMEEAAWKSVQPCLEEGSGTVGTRMEITHDAPTPVGMTVRAESELIAVDGRKLTFAVSAYDEAGKIGGGTHERFIIRNESFQKKADGKAVKL